VEVFGLLILIQLKKLEENPLEEVVLQEVTIPIPHL